jgi:hypothetical protein
LPIHSSFLIFRGSLLWRKTDNSRWIPKGDTKRRHVLYYDAAGADDRTFSDRDTLPNHGPFPNPGIPADANRFDVLFGGRETPGARFRIAGMAVRISKSAPAGDKDVVFDKDLAVDYKLD